MAKIKLLSEDDKLSYFTITDSYANTNTIDIYLKFISCLTEDELSFLDSIREKDILSLSQVELDKYYSIKTQLNMVELLKKYKDRGCTKEEHDSVFEFMKNNPLKSFVRKSINIDDRIRAYKFIDDLVHESNETLHEYIDSQEEIYNELSVFDAYILFEAKEHIYSIEQNELNDRIRKESFERDKNLRKSLYKDYGLI